MATSIRQFNIELHREHLEEASFLYGQRLAYLHDPEVKWPDLDGWEERFEGHIDALVVGGELALDVCRKKASEGDVGELHATLRVLCRLDRKDEAVAMLQALDSTDDQALEAASRALRCDAPSSWRDDLLRLVRDDRTHLTGLLARVVGYRRFACEELLANKLASQPPFGAADLAWALGRVGTAQSIPVLEPLLGSEDESVCEAAAIALLRLGHNRTMEHATLAAPRQRWARRVLGIGGNARSVRVLLDVVDGGGADPATVQALGLLGDLSAVSPLLELLGDEALSAPAAVALNTITGAGLHADRFVPDKVDPDELLDEEREAYERDGTLPMRDGQPYGTWEHGPLRDQQGWRAWLEANKQRFSREHRWRMGQPYGPSALLECLKDEATPFAIRGASYEELVVRYGLNVPFEPELQVRQQLRFLAKIEGWARTESARAGTGS